MNKPGSQSNEPARILVGRGKRETLANIVVGGMSASGTSPTSILKKRTGTLPLTELPSPQHGCIKPLAWHQSSICKGCIIVCRDDQMIEHVDIEQLATLNQFAGQREIGTTGL